jgi:Ca2+-binding EF-hand superfamily protein
MENPTGTFDFEAADVNEDGAVNVTDIVGMVNIIMSSGSRMEQQETMAVLKEYGFIFKGDR